MARFLGWIALPAIAAAGGCHLLIGLDGGTPGTGGASSSTSGSGASSSVTSSSNGGMGGAGGSTSSTSSMGGSGGSSSTSSSSSGVMCDGGATCSDATECPDTMSECVERTCVASCCGTSFPGAEKAVAVGQVAGDCTKVVCDGAGATTSVDDDQDPPADKDECHMAMCASGAATQVPVPAGMTCSFGGGKVCGDPAGASAGLCVACNDAADCPAGNACVANACVGTVLILGAGATSTIGGEFHPGGLWATTSLGGRSTDEITLAITTSGKAVGALRIPKTSAPDDEQVWFTTWTATASFSPFAAIDALTIFARIGPSISAGNVAAQLVFHGTDFKHYYLAYDGAAWSPAEAVGVQTFGPTPAAIAARAADASIVYFDGFGTPASNKPNAQDRATGVWQAKVQLDTTTSFTSSPALVAMTAGADLMAVYARSSGAIFSQTRTGGVWSAPLAIPGAITGASRPALAALPGGDAIMAFRGNDTNLYYATYTAGAWTGVAAFATPAVSIVGTPALARGASGATAEIAFVKTSDKVAYHARLAAGAWTTPVAVGGVNLSNVAIASAP